MQKLIRTTLLAALLLVFGVSVASAQTYELVADSTELSPDSGPPDAHCIVEASDGTLVFFNSEAGGIYAWDGSTLIEHTSPINLNENISAESSTIDRCDAVAIDGNDSVYFSFRSSSGSGNYIYKTFVSDPASVTVKEVGGSNGLAVDGSTLYIAGVAQFGATRDGIFEISSDLSGDTTAVATNPDVALEDAIDISSSGLIYGISEGSGSFAGNIVSVDPSASSPSFQAFVDPYASGVLTGDAGGNIDDLEAIDFGGSTYLVVFNNSFQASNGEEFGTIKVSDQSVSILFTQVDLTGNLSYAGAYDPGFTEPLYANANGDVFVTSANRFGAKDYIAKVSGSSPLPVEMAGFDAVQNNNAVELTWETASETNNAGFTVQRETESGWTSLGFVESKVSGGTTTETTAYRYTVDQELDPGTHRFRLQQKDLDGSTSRSDVVTVDVGLDEALTLSAPAPNPTTGPATLKFGVKTSTDVTVSVYNVLGQRVQTLYQGTPQAGQVQDVTVDASSLSSGVYFVRMQADGQTRTERLTVVR